jgi:hypothetical protein
MRDKKTDINLRGERVQGKGIRHKTYLRDIKIVRQNVRVRDEREKKRETEQNVKKDR